MFFSPGLFNDSVCLFEFSCVAVQGAKKKTTHGPERKPWDAKQTHTPWFCRGRELQHSQQFSPVAEKMELLVLTTKLLSPFQRDEIAGAL